VSVSFLKWSSSLCCWVITTDPLEAYLLERVVQLERIPAHDAYNYLMTVVLCVSDGAKLIIVCITRYPLRLEYQWTSPNGRLPIRSGYPVFEFAPKGLFCGAQSHVTNSTG
jgi:hypothetical protein